ncbi:TPA: hypothetical protein ACMDQP_003097 [Vibrio cholerae]
MYKITAKHHTTYLMKIKELLAQIPSEEKEVCLNLTSDYWSTLVACELGKLGFTLTSIVTIDNLVVFKR